MTVTVVPEDLLTVGNFGAVFERTRLIVLVEEALPAFAAGCGAGADRREGMFESYILMAETGWSLNLKFKSVLFLYINFK